MKSPFAATTVLEFIAPTQVRWKGRRLLYFGGCDYLRLSHHRAVRHSVCTGLHRFGLSVAASRLTTGNHPLYSKVEAELRRFFRAPAARLVPTGYVSNLIVAQALKGWFTHVLIDARAHASLQDASQILGCPVQTFRHRNTEDLTRKAKACGGRDKILVMTDGMYAYDGAAAPLRSFQAAVPASAWLLVDDAHGAGVLGRTGRGTLEHEQVGYANIIQTITLSKAFGSYGGAILAPAEIHERILSQSHFFSGSTPVPLPLANAALSALRLLDAHPRWLETLRRKTRYARETLRAAALPQPDHPGPIISFAPGPKQVARLRKALLAEDIYPTFLRYPGGPASGYFRFAISHVHRQSELDRLLRAVTGALK